MPHYAYGIFRQTKNIFLNYIYYNMSLMSRFLRSKKQDLFIRKYILMQIVGSNILDTNFTTT